jgi:hypothetical protein
VPGTLSGSRDDSGVTRNVRRLLADLTDASHDDVVDERRICARAVDERIQHFPRKVRGMPSRQSSASPSARGA